MTLQARQMAVIRQIVIIPTIDNAAQQQAIAAIPRHVMRARAIAVSMARPTKIPTQTMKPRMGTAAMLQGTIKHKMQAIGEHSSIPQARRDTIPLMGIHIIPSMRTVAPIGRARQKPVKGVKQNGPNPTMNALSINPSEHIHAT